MEGLKTSFIRQRLKIGHDFYLARKHTDVQGDVTRQAQYQESGPHSLAVRIENELCMCWGALSILVHYTVVLELRPSPCVQKSLIEHNNWQ
jgi:hypothetical protein